MNQSSLVTTVTVEPMGVRGDIETILAPLSEVRFLVDLPDDATKVECLRESSCLLTMMPLKEIPAAAWRYAQHWQFVQFMSAGVDQMDFSLLPRQVKAADNGGAYDLPMAEHALAMALCLSKKLLPKHEMLRRGEFDQFTPTGTLRGKVCAVLGLGGVGREAARLFRFLGMRVHAINRTGKTDQEVDFIGTLDDLEPVLRQADLVLVTLANTQSTANLLDEERISWLKPTVIVLNLARGSLVDEAALYRFLKDNPESGAGIDAWWKEPFVHGEFRLNFPFLDLPNVIGSPHNSPQIPGAMQHSIRRAAENLARYLTGGEVRGMLQWDERGVL